MTGSEIKSIRQNKVNIKESYASAENGEIFLINCNIPRYQNSIDTNYNPRRNRKLLLNKKEINKLFAATQKKGMTIVPTKLYFNKKKDGENTEKSEKEDQEVAEVEETQTDEEANDQQEQEVEEGSKSEEEPKLKE